MRIAIITLFALSLGGCAVEVPLNGFSFQPSTSRQQTDDREAELDKRKQAIILRLKRENPRLGTVEAEIQAREELQVQLSGPPPASAYTSATED